MSGFKVSATACCCPDQAKAPDPRCPTPQHAKRGAARVARLAKAEEHASVPLTDAQRRQLIRAARGL